MHVGLLSIFQNYCDGLDDSDVLDGELKLALAAEELGFDSYWAPEHHFFGYSISPDNIQWLAQVGALTSRIKLGPAAIIVPWNDPYRAAAKMALLDQQTGGRALLGFGRGLARREYECFGIPMDEARGRFDEGAALILDALNQGFMEADTTHFKQPRVELRPRPTAAFADRVFSIGVSPESATQAAVLGAQLMVLAQQPWEVFREQALEPYQEKWRSLYSTAPPVPMAGQLLYCHEDPVRAQELGKKYVLEYFASVVEHYEIGGKHFKDVKGYEFYGSAAEVIKEIGMEAMAEMYASVNCYGTPEQIIAILQEQRDILGCAHNVIMIPKYGTMTQEEAEASVSLFARKVMPHFKAADGQ
jgi:alkanesulfonate monooxygenase SsuD/methylene tetrahydromethanopterin reductase-like flavin-dependent oxidoreductase (luciferase family)